MDKKIIKKLHRGLLALKKSVSTAESCTGGLLSEYLTSEPGSTGYFICGVVAYSIMAKERFLSIPGKIISKHGAVSEQVARLMAQNIRRKTNADFGISITGIAGPKSIEDKPVGTVFICLSEKKRTVCRKFLFQGNRGTIRSKSALMAISLLCAHLSP